MKIKITTTLALACAWPFTAEAGLESFFGQYVSPYLVDGINQMPRPTNLVAVVNAQNPFYGRLSGLIVESFEGFAVGSVPTTLNFGTNTAVYRPRHWNQGKAWDLIQGFTALDRQ